MEGGVGEARLTDIWLLPPRFPVVLSMTANKLGLPLGR